MKKLILPVLLIFTLGSHGSAGEDCQNEGSAQVEFPDYKSRQQVEKEAEDQAIINALENAFGRAVIESNSTYLVEY